MGPKFNPMTGYFAAPVFVPGILSFAVFVGFETARMK